MLVTINDKKVYYERFGKGEPVLLVHGWGGTSESMRALAKLLSKKYETIIIDLPGFGQSDNPGADWGVEEYATFLKEFIVTVVVSSSRKRGSRLDSRSGSGMTNSVIYFGHSFGGTIGIFLATHHSNLIDTLILAAPSYKRSAAKKTVFSGLTKRLPFLKFLVYGMLFRKSDLLKNPALEPNFRKIMTQDMSAEATKVGVPTLLLWGDADTYVPIEQGRALHQIIKGSKLVVFPGLRHGVPLTNPELIEKEIEKFVT